ncbi:DUF1361 domain-containing protein [Heyndrickxia sporothermodurans]|nr:DUF1361 domain-containing protein [Heyndrickxia sporothermodurans]
MNERSKARISFFLYLALLLIFDHQYSFMILNIFLAFAALELSFLLPLFKVRSKRDIPGSALFYLVFILLSPNVFYVVTDAIHLNIYEFDYESGLVMEEWWNFFVLVCGILLAVFYYTLMMKQIVSLFASEKWQRIIVIVFILLSSIGIYIGRFLRFHSIHLFTEPLSLYHQIIRAMNGDFFLFILLISLLQFLICWTLTDFRRRTL